MATQSLTQEQEAEQARITENYKAHALRINTLALFTGDVFPPRKKGAEHVPLLAAMRALHSALTRYEQQGDNGDDLYGPLAEVFVQIGERLIALLAAADATE